MSDLCPQSKMFDRSRPWLPRSKKCQDFLGTGTTYPSRPAIRHATMLPEPTDYLGFSVQATWERHEPTLLSRDRQFPRYTSKLMIWTAHS